MGTQALFLMLALTAGFAAVPMAAQSDLYNNGPINGDIDAYTINNGYVVSDTFTLTSSSAVNGMVFGAWVYPGDVLQTAEVSLTSSPDGGTTYFDQTLSFTQSNCGTGSFGLYYCTETTSFSPVQMSAGTYWLNIQNASVPDGDPVYWDENRGEGCTSPGCPSEGYDTYGNPSRPPIGFGSIPSESFTILGSAGGGSTPEPSSLLLFGSGVVGVVGWLRRNGRRPC
jgi:PEP-CTERM motif